MKRLLIETRGICDWWSRLADPEKQWKAGYSAMLTAESWEAAANEPSGLPQSIADLFRSAGYGEPELGFGIAEHKVPLEGGEACSQCDVWALIKSTSGFISVAVEAKAKEPFGNQHECLATWLVAGTGKASIPNRQSRWQHIQQNLPAAPPGAYDNVAYQILHRCAAAVIEAKRLGLQHAAFVVQSFESPPTSFLQYERFCNAIGVPAGHGQMNRTTAAGIDLGVGWAD